MSSRFVLLALLLNFFLTTLAAEESNGEIAARVAFLKNYCLDCHADGMQEGGLDLDSLPVALDSPEHFAAWERIFGRVEAGEMPPADYEQPSAKSRKDFLEMLGRNLRKTHAARKETVLRRLNRREYQNTLNDVFGTALDLESDLPPDARAGDFSNNGEALGISLVHMEKYLAAADAVIDAAIAKTEKRPPWQVVTATYAETGEGKKFIGKLWDKLDDGAVVFYQRLGYPSGMLRGTEVKPPGRYKVRVTGYAYRSKEPITLRIGGTSFLRGSEKLTHGYAALHPGEAQTVELEAYIPNRYMIELDPWGIGTGSYNIRRDGIEGYKGAGLAILKVELEGPILEQYPSRGHDLLFDDFQREVVPRRNKWTKEDVFKLSADDPVASARATLHRIAEKVFRRPVDVDEMDLYVDLFQQEQETGAELESALKTAVSALLCSPDFIYLRENTGWLDDHALATRLSYFLTRSSPDVTLRKAADDGNLASDPAMLLSETNRLLESELGNRFVEDLCDDWLNLRDIEFTNPDQALFPEFDTYLQYSMLEETRGFVRYLISENLPVVNLVQSEFAMLNDRLAEHYELPPVSGPELRPIKLPAGSMRGGLLSQGAILKVSANGTNTSPVVRGTYVMDRILGQAPQPPPPGIPGVEPDIRGATTLRDLLAKHRNQDDCRACHAKIDPPGFALESFNPIGGFRERFRSLGEGDKVNLEIRGRKVRYRLGPDVDSSGELPTGQAFADYKQFRKHLAADPRTLARSLVEKLLTFGTGREMGFSDRETIEEILDKCAGEQYRVRDLLEQSILSEAFRRK